MRADDECVARVSDGDEALATVVVECASVHLDAGGNDDEVFRVIP